MSVKDPKTACNTPKAFLVKSSSPDLDDTVDLDLPLPAKGDEEYQRRGREASRENRMALGSVRPTPEELKTLRWRRKYAVVKHLQAEFAEFRWNTVPSEYNRFWKEFMYDLAGEAKDICEHKDETCVRFNRVNWPPLDELALKDVDSIYEACIDEHGIDPTHPREVRGVTQTYFERLTKAWHPMIAPK